MLSCFWKAEVSDLGSNLEVVRALEGGVRPYLSKVLPTLVFSKDVIAALVGFHRHLNTHMYACIYVSMYLCIYVSMYVMSCHVV